MLPELAGVIVASVIGLFVDILTLYVMPLVFLRKRGIAAIPMGIKILLAKVKQSLPLIVLILLTFPINIYSRLYAMHLSQADFPKALTVALLHNLSVSFIEFVVFITAAIMLTLDASMQKNTQGAMQAEQEDIIS